MSVDFAGRPYVWTLPLSNKTLLFRDLLVSSSSSSSSDQSTMTDEAFLLVRDAAQRADNVAIDEIPSASYLAWIMSMANDVIALYDDVTEASTTGSRYVGRWLLIISESPFRRSLFRLQKSLFVLKSGWRINWPILCGLYKFCRFYFHLDLFATKPICLSTESFWTLDEAAASTVVIVIVPGSDGRMGGRKRFCRQLIIFKR